LLQGTKSGEVEAEPIPEETQTMPALFSLGALVATPAAIEAISEGGQTAAEFLDRHAQGDWGDVCEDDKTANDEAIREGSRILSAYRTANGVKLWVITEADRSSTCCLLPSDY
jgi:hypothetical protein